jgi:hypothetical protein
MYGFKNMDVTQNGRTVEWQDGRTQYFSMAGCMTAIGQDVGMVGRKTTIRMMALSLDGSSTDESLWTKVRRTKVHGQKLDRRKFDKSSTDVGRKVK